MPRGGLVLPKILNRLCVCVCVMYCLEGQPLHVEGLILSKQDECEEKGRLYTLACG